jgi:hypothetical protein
MELDVLTDLRKAGAPVIFSRLQCFPRTGDAFLHTVYGNEAVFTDSLNTILILLLKKK